jgi:hypothetical protein
MALGQSKSVQHKKINYHLRKSIIPVSQNVSVPQEFFFYDGNTY